MCDKHLHQPAQRLVDFLKKQSKQKKKTDPTVIDYGHSNPVSCFCIRCNYFISLFFLKSVWCIKITIIHPSCITIYFYYCQCIQRFSIQSVRLWRTKNIVPLDYLVQPHLLAALPCLHSFSRQHQLLFHIRSSFYLCLLLK